MPITATLPRLLHSFFHDWLAGQRNIAPHTITSYRDTWRLFLRFVAERQRRPVDKLVTEQLTAAQVLLFLEHCERERRVSIGTRNCRLAALRRFFAFVAAREPLLAAHCAEVLRIPTKRAPRRPLRSLEPEEVKAILAQPDRSTLEGQRDQALLALLYNTGARIQEALDLPPQDVRLTSPAQIRVIGKGRKERICPLWPETVAILQAFLKRQPNADRERFFVNRYGEPLGASGVRFKLRKYVKAAAKQVPSLAKKRVTPHLFRHSTAVHMLAAGVDITVIGSLLGHDNLNTTNHYAQANLETKRRALETVSSRPGKPPRWHRKPELLKWLDSL